MKACLKCKDRYVGCHDRCDKPERLREVENNRLAREARARESDVDAFTIDAVRHSVRQAGRTLRNT